MSSTDNFPEIKSGVADAILAGIMRQILNDNRVSPARLGDMIAQYSRKMTHWSPAKRSQFYGNVLSDLNSGQMTWRTFKRGPMVLNAKRVKITLNLQHQYVSTDHVLIIEYGEPHEYVDSIEDENGKIATELSEFFNRIMYDLGVDVGIFNRLLTGYMRRQKIDPTRMVRAYARSNLKKELLNTRMSWASFVKGLDFLTILSCNVNVELEFHTRKGRVKRSKHRYKMVINNIEEMMAVVDEGEILNPVIIDETMIEDVLGKEGNATEL